jgi:hypothetical protein
MRELLDTVCSNFFLNGKKLGYIYRKPFDLLAEGLSSANWLPGGYFGRGKHHFLCPFCPLLDFGKYQFLEA